MLPVNVCNSAAAAVRGFLSAGGSGQQTRLVEVKAHVQAEASSEVRLFDRTLRLSLQSCTRRRGLSRVPAKERRNPPGVRRRQLLGRTRATQS